MSITTRCGRLPLGLYLLSFVSSSHSRVHVLGFCILPVCLARKCLLSSFCVRRLLAHKNILPVIIIHRCISGWLPSDMSASQKVCPRTSTFFSLFVSDQIIHLLISKLDNPHNFKKALYIAIVAGNVLFSFIGFIIYVYVCNEYMSAPAFGSRKNVYMRITFKFGIPTVVFLVRTF